MPNIGGLKRIISPVLKALMRAKADAEGRGTFPIVQSSERDFAVLLSQQEHGTCAEAE
jgi:hypothetical protein